MFLFNKNNLINYFKLLFLFLFCTGHVCKYGITLDYNKLKRKIIK